MTNDNDDPIIKAGARLDPDAERVLFLIRAAGRPPYDTLTPAEAREASARGRQVVQPDPPQLDEIKDFDIPGPAGAIPARLYRASAANRGATQPVLIYFHGGGWVIGDLDSHDVLCRQLADQSGVVVISVGYRLAPEHRFPAAVDDAFAATQWIAKEAGRLGLDPSRIAVGGDSAGGNLATIAAIMARDQGGPKLAFQLLIYPSTDLSMTQMSHTEHAGQQPLTAAVMTYFRQHYLGNEDLWTDWRASPLSAPSLKKLPPALIITAGHDVLVDEGYDYADRLKVSGVKIEHRHYPGQIHGFITMGRIIREANLAVAQSAAALKAALA
jgi:acetyl esterase